VYAAH